MALILIPLGAACAVGTSVPKRQYVAGRVRLAFDDTTEQPVAWTFRWPGGSAHALKVLYSMASATTNNVAIGSRLMAVTPGDAADMDTDSYATQDTSADSAVPGTAGHLKEISLTLSNLDGAAAGDYVALEVRREVTTSGTNAAGDMEVWSLALEYTP